jgi:TPR repeat protein
MQPSRARSPLPAGALIALVAAVGVSALGCSDIDRTRWKARFGNPDAQIALAAAYAQGNGVEKSAVEAAVWYRKAAEQKRPDAAGELARLYAGGEGI